MDQISIETDWRQRGFSSDLWTDPASQRWENFVHNVDEVVMVVIGTVEFEIGGETHRPDPSRGIVHSCGYLHSVRNIGSSTAPWLYRYRETSGSR